MMSEPEKFQELLKRSRKKRGWSQQILAEKIGATPVTINRWERGVATPSLFYQQRLCDLFNLSMEDFGFIKGAGEEKEQQKIQNHPITHFFFCTNLTSSQEFYNRVAERNTLLNRIFNHASTSLVGSRRIGKTWLMEYLLLEAKQQLGANYRIGYIDANMASVATIDGFVARAIKVFGVAVPEQHSSLDLQALEAVVERLRSKNIFPVLCIDEFDAFLGNKNIFNLFFFSALRALAHSGLTLVVASRKPIIEIVGNDGMTSGFFNIFEQVTVEPFTFLEAQRFVEAKAKFANLTDLERAALMKYGTIGNNQWPPIRLQLVGKMLWEDKTLVLTEGEAHYRVEDSDYWQKFEQRLEEKYRGVVR